MNADTKEFPIQGGWNSKTRMYFNPSSIPWGLIAPHEQRAIENHAGQNLRKLASRGGLTPCEALAVLEDRPWRIMDACEATKRLSERVQNWNLEHATNER